VADDIKVLFVCTANICRSAFAEALTRHLLAEDPAASHANGVEVSSAGVYGFVDEPMDEAMAAELVRRGGDPSYFRSRRLTMGMVDAADLVLTAEVAHRRFILDDRPGVFRQMFTLGQFMRMLPDLPPDSFGQALLAAARKGLKPADPRDDLPDPYRQGPEAAAEVAARIDADLQVILPRLTGRVGAS
jgi:protein-tyrosine-phosphatase